MTATRASAPGVRLALIQMSCTGDKEANITKAVARIRDAAAAGAQLVCLQELFATPYPCQEEDHDLFGLAEPIPGPVHDRLQAVAAQLEIVLISSLFERRTHGLYHNTVVVFDADGSSLGMYRKMHIPDDPHYYEKFYFAPGDLGFRSFATRCGRIGVGICWDQWYPEAARLMALHGAEILFYPTAIGWLAREKPQYGESQRAAWETSMRAHAIANGVFVAAVNRVGLEGQIEFWGSSFVCDPYGNFLHRASQQEELIVVDCDRGLIDTARTHWPFLRDRRIDAYGDLTRRFID